MRLMMDACTCWGAKKTTEKRTSNVMSKSTEICSLDDLPLEILPNIFSRLPVKSILSCMAASNVSKAVISDSSMHGFSSIYRTNNPYSITAIAYKESRFPLSLIDCERATSDTSETSLPAPGLDASSSEYFSVCGNCDGLVCLLKIQNGYLSLFFGNPTLGQFLQLPHPVPLGRNEERFLACGLGYCQSTHKYKVLRIITYYKYHYINTTQIFTIGVDKEWKAVMDANVPYNMLSRNTMLNPTEQNDMIAFNSRLHWIVQPVNILWGVLKPRWGGMCYICAFDLKEEKVDAIPLPPETDTTSTRRSCGRLGTLSDKLCLYKITDSADLDIWVMLHYDIAASWTKQFSLLTSSIPACREMSGCCAAVAISNEGVIILKGGVCYVFYDLISNNTFLALHTKNLYRGVLNYIPSFVPLSYL